MLAGVLLLIGLGIADDIHNLNAAIKLFIQIFAIHRGSWLQVGPDRLRTFEQGRKVGIVSRVDWRWHCDDDEICFADDGWISRVG